MRRVAIAVLLVGLVAGCGSPARPPGTDPTSLPAAPPATVSPPTVPPATAPPASGSATAPPAATPAPGPDRTAADSAYPDAGPPGLLAAISTSHHADHDRVVFQFHGRRAPVPVVRYVDRVTADPSDRPVPLRGRTFVTVVFHGGRLDTAATETDPAHARRYAGPTRLTPRYPLLQELAVAGDFEAVLSVGLGLSSAAGLSQSAPAGSGRVVLDLWRTAPDTLVWPVTTVAQAREVQRGTRDGHQPWTLRPEQVAGLFTERVLGWRQAEVRRVGEHVFQVEQGGQVAILTLSQPLGDPHTVWAVASVIRSG